jgi:hypothetical protein
MSRSNALAFLLAGAVVAAMAMPAAAAPRAKSSAAWQGNPFASGSQAFAQGSRHLNQNGVRFRTPPDCAYPLRYDSGGNAVFQRFGCRLP